MRRTTRGVARLDGAMVKKQVWCPMFELKALRGQMCCIEESTCDILGIFRRTHVIWRPGIVTPLSTPLLKNEKFRQI